MNTEDKMINAALFYEFLMANGLNPENSRGILELHQDAFGSVSQFLTNYNQFLLSKRVKYPEIASLDIIGARGFVEQGEIFVPKSLASDQYFFHDRIVLTPYKKPHYSYDLPSIEEFDTLISLGFSDDLLRSIPSMESQYVGLCKNKGDQQSLDVTTLNWYIEQLNHETSDTYYLNHEVDTKHGKELYLVQKRK